MNQHILIKKDFTQKLNKLIKDMENISYESPTYVLPINAIKILNKSQQNEK